MTPEQHPLWPAFVKWYQEEFNLVKRPDFVYPTVQAYWSCFLAGAAAQENQEQLEK